MPTDSKAAMSKRQLIDDIRRYNTTAKPQFLAQFDEAALRQYLDHLEDARQKHLRPTIWTNRRARLRMVG